MAKKVNDLTLDSTTEDVFNGLLKGLLQVAKNAPPDRNSDFVIDGLVKLFPNDRMFKTYNARNSSWTNLVSLDQAPAWSSITGKPTIPVVTNTESSTSTTQAASPSLVRKIFESSKNLTIYTGSDAYPNVEPGTNASYHNAAYRIIDRNNAIQFKLGESSTHIYWVQAGQIARRTGANNNQHSVTLMNNHNGSVICGLGTGNGARGGNKTVTLSVDNQIGYSKTVSYSISGEDWAAARGINLAMINYLIIYKTKK